MKQSTQPFQGRFLGKRTDNPGFGNPGLKYTIPSGLTSISRTLERTTMPTVSRPIGRNQNFKYVWLGFGSNRSFFDPSGRAYFPALTSKPW